LLGKPLLVHSIERALESGLFSVVAVSSDSAEILRIASTAGAEELVERPAELASDTADKMPAIQHCVRTVEERRGTRYEVMVDLDVTSPLRAVEDILGAVHLLESTDAENVLTGTPSARSPYYNMLERGPDGYVRLPKTPDRPILRRQDAPMTWDMNASIYVWRREPFFREGDGIILNRTAVWQMPPERSLDVDSAFDFELVEFLASRKATS